VTSQKSQDLPSLDLSGTRTPWSPVATCTLSAEHTVRSAPSFTSTPPPQIRSECNYVTSKTETENRFWPYPKPKNRFYRTNPVLETLRQTTFAYHDDGKCTHRSWRVLLLRLECGDGIRRLQEESSTVPLRYCPDKKRMLVYTEQYVTEYV